MIPSLHIPRPALIRALLFAACVLVIYLFMPRTEAGSYDFEVNKAWNYDDIVAPFDIEIYHTPAQQQHLVDSATAQLRPAFFRSDEVAARVAKQFSVLLDKQHRFHSHPRSKTVLINRLERIYDNGIIDLSTLGSAQPDEISLRKNQNEFSTVPSATYISPRDAYGSLIKSVEADTMLYNALCDTRLSTFLEPNIVYDSIFNSRQAQDIATFYAAPKGKKMQGQTIIERGAIVTPETYSIIQTYLSKLDSINPTTPIYISIGKLALIIILFAMMFTYLRVFRPDYYASFRQLLFLCVMLVTFILFAFILYSAFPRGLYMVPLAIVPIVVIVFLDSRTAFFTFLIPVMLCAAICHYMWDFILIQFVAGFVTMISIRDLSKRSQLLKAALFIFLAYCLTYSSLVILQSGHLDALDPRMYGAFGINCILISFAYFLIFVNEKAFGFISRVTLVELSDINSPLLRELSEECPGTFQHSMAVSNLASTAAAKVGANAQLIRTGALFHDIGKITNPAFFTENQHGVNPHDALSPLQSAKIVIGHVAEGLRRADKANLPEAIRRFIREHHGRGKARYFYTSYCNARPDTEVDPAPFTYPGPNPQTLESSILMMADAVEAASRSLKDHSPDAITSLVNKIIDTQVAEGLHNESPISFRDIALIKQSFASTLRTMYHSRISYPEAVQPSNPS